MGNKVNPMTISALFELFLIGALGFSVLYTLTAAVIYAIHRLRDRKIPPAKELPAVSILKPLRGLDDQLELNLRSFFELDYPEFELIFAVQVKNDPAIEVVKKLQAEYPRINSALIIDESRIGLNPKINNLCNAYPLARHQFLLISDSNVRVERDYLREMMAQMTMPKVGLVTSTIRGVGARSMGAILENLHLNSFIAPNVYAIKQLFRVPITIGKSMLLRRETLEKMGGLFSLRDHLAEDHLIGQGVKSQGLRIRTSSEPINNVNQSWTVDRFCARHIRWGKMRRHFNLFHYAGEILSNPVILALIWFAWQRTTDAALLAGSVILGKTLVDYLVAQLTGGDLKTWHFLLVPIKELLLLGMWLVPFFENSVEWRGNRFAIGRNTLLQPAIHPAAGRVLSLRESFGLDTIRDRVYGRVSNLLQVIELSRRLTFYATRRR